MARLTELWCAAENKQYSKWESGDEEKDEKQWNKIEMAIYKNKIILL